MKKTIIVLIVIAVLLGAILLMGPFYVVDEGQMAVVTRFGKIENVATEAGLHFKLPFLDNILYYSKKVLPWDGDAQRIPTKENQFIWVDVTARWRISDPQKFYESVSTMTKAHARLDEIIDSSVRTVIAENSLSEAVRDTNQILTSAAASVIGTQNAETGEIQGPETTNSNFESISIGRQGLSEQIRQNVGEIVPQFGIEILDVVIRQIRYSDDLTQSVYNRMIAERNQIASYYRSEGEGLKQEWLGKLENDQRRILSEAYATSEEIKGEADAAAAAIYADAYRDSSEFYQFWRSIESYRKTLPQFRSTLSTDMDYFQYLYNPQGE